MPINCLYSYVSHTFLNAFINHVKILKAFVLGIYYDWSEIFKDDASISVMSPPGSCNWVDIICRSNFQDDVLILGKTKNIIPDKTPCYFFFWYDRDCSDCCIGRFVTNDNEQTVINLFSDYINILECNRYGAKEIPLHYFKGWISS